MFYCMYEVLSTVVIGHSVTWRVRHVMFKVIIVSFVCRCGGILTSTSTMPIAVPARSSVLYTHTHT